MNVFLPASQVDIRRPADIGDFIGRVVQCEVLKIDEARRNIVVSRRSLIEKQRQEDREQLLRELEVGQTPQGSGQEYRRVRRIRGPGRNRRPASHYRYELGANRASQSKWSHIDQEIEVMILNIDREKEKIALGLKQKTSSPWENVETTLPGGKHGDRDEVVNVMSYGAFVKLEEGIEGLVHISEMSWTKRVSHPSELVQIGDEI